MARNRQFESVQVNLGKKTAREDFVTQMKDYFLPAENEEVGGEKTSGLKNEENKSNSNQSENLSGTKNTPFQHDFTTSLLGNKPEGMFALKNLLDELGTTESNKNKKEDKPDRKERKAKKILEDSQLEFSDEYYSKDHPVALKMERKYARKYWDYYAEYLLTNYEIGMPLNEGETIPYKYEELRKLDEGDGEFLVIYAPDKDNRDQTVQTETISDTPSNNTIDPDIVISTIGADPEMQNQTISAEDIPKNLVYTDAISGKLVVEAASNTEAFQVLNTRKLLQRNVGAPFIWRENKKNGQVVDHHRLYNFAPPDQWFNRSIPYSETTVNNLLYVAGPGYKYLADIIKTKKTFFNPEFAELVRATQKKLYPDNPTAIDGKFGTDTSAALDTYIELQKDKERKDSYNAMLKEVKLHNEGEPNPKLNKRPGDNFYNYYRDGRVLIINRTVLKNLTDAIDTGDDDVALGITNDAANNMADYGYMLSPEQRKKLLWMYADSWVVGEAEEKVVDTILENVPPSQTVNLMFDLENNNSDLYKQLKAKVDNYETRQRFYTATEKILGKVDAATMAELSLHIKVNWDELDVTVGYLSPGQMLSLGWAERKDLLDKLLDDTYWTDFDAQRFVDILRNTPAGVDRDKLRPLILPQAGEDTKFYDSVVGSLSATAKTDFFALLKEFYPTYHNVRKIEVLDESIEEDATIFEPWATKPIDVLRDLDDGEMESLDIEKRLDLLTKIYFVRIFGLDDADQDAGIKLIKTTPPGDDAERMRQRLISDDSEYNDLKLLYEHFDDAHISTLKGVLKELFKNDNRLVQKVKDCVINKSGNTESIAYLLSDEMLTQFTGLELADLVRQITAGSYTDGWNEELIINIFKIAGNVPEVPKQKPNESLDEFKKRQNEYNVAEARRSTFKTELDKDDQKLWNEVQGDVQMFNDDLIRIAYNRLDNSPTARAARKQFLTSSFDSGNYLIFYAALAYMPENEMKDFTKEERVKYLRRISLLDANWLEKINNSVGDVSENAIIRLLASTPDGDEGYVLDALYENGGELQLQLNYRIDGSEYKDFYDTIESLQTRRDYSKSSTNTNPSQVNQGNTPAKPPANVNTDMQVDNLVAYLLETEELKKEYQQVGSGVKNILPYSPLGIIKKLSSLDDSYTFKATMGTVEEAVPGKPGEKVAKNKVVVVCFKNTAITRVESYDPEEIVGLQYVNEKGENEAGHVEFMHATKLLYYSNEQENQAISEVVDVVALILAVIPGTQILSGAIKGIQAAMIIADVIFTVSDLYYISYKDELEKTQEGRAFLSFYDTMGKVMLLAAGPMILASPAVLRKAKEVIAALGDEFADMKAQLTKILGLENDAALEQKIANAQKEKNLAGLAVAAEESGLGNKTGEFITGENKVLEPVPTNQGKKTVTPEVPKSTVTKQFIKDGVEYFDDQGKYYKRTTPGSKAEPIAESDFLIARGLPPKAQPKNFFNSLAEKLDAAKAANKLNIDDTWNRLQEIWDKLINGNYPDAVLTPELQPLAMTPNGISPFRIRATGEVDIFGSIFDACNGRIPDFERTVRVFNDIGQQIKLLGSEGKDIAGLVGQLVHNGLKLAFFSSYDKFLIFLRKTIGVTDKMLTDLQLAKIWDDIVAGAKSQKSLEASIDNMTADEAKKFLDDLETKKGTMNEDDYNALKKKAEDKVNGVNSPIIIKGGEKRLKGASNNQYQISGENQMADWDIKKKVTYLKTEADRAPFEVFVGDDGLLYKMDGTLLDTKSMETIFSKGGKGIYVMDEYGHIYVNAQKYEQFHHSSFLAGGKIASAGEIVVENGKLKYLNAKSGHYVPDPPELSTGQIKTELAGRGADMDGVQIERGFKK